MNAVRLWLRHYKHAWHDNGRKPQSTPQSRTIKWAEGEDGESLVERFALPAPEMRTGLDEEQVRQLAQLFLAARAKRGGRGEFAAVRDARIVALLSQGYNNLGIAHELEIPPEHVKVYRRQIRHMLRQIASV